MPPLLLFFLQRRQKFHRNFLFSKKFPSLCGNALLIPLAQGPKRLHKQSARRFFPPGSNPPPKQHNRINNARNIGHFIQISPIDQAASVPVAQYQLVKARQKQAARQPARGVQPSQIPINCSVTPDVFESQLSSQ